MNIPRSFTALIVSTLLGCLSGTAWAEEATLYQSISQGEPAAASPDSNTAARQAPATPAMPGQYWQQPPQWRMPQPMYPQFQPRHPYGGQYRAYPGTPAAAAPAPHTTELKQAQEQLAAKSSELDAANSTIEQLHVSLQESNAAATRLSDKLTYSSREQQALRMRVIELTQALEQQNLQCSAERDQLHGKLAGLDIQLAELQSSLQAATRAVLQARSSLGMAGAGTGTARAQIETLRDALGRLEAELERQEANPE